MRSMPKFVGLVGAVLGAGGALGIIVVGCGGDDTEVSPDASQFDATSDGDTGTPRTDGTASETGSDAGADVLIEPDALPPVEAFPMEATIRLCERYRECCQVPVESWNQQRCVTGTNIAGGVQNLFLHAAALADGGVSNVQYDTAQALLCLARIQGVSCTVTSADYLAIRNACFGALRGTIPLDGGGCTDAIQCAAGRCDTSIDGGVCADFIADGGACASSDDCSYRGVYQPPMFCDDGISRHPDAAVCGPQLPVDGNCGESAGPVADIEGACTTGICAGNGDIGACAPSAVLTPIQFCNDYILPDAGTQDAGDAGDSGDAGG
jgi:hypothetical protein